MKALIYRAEGLIIKDLIGVLGRYGLTDAWVVGSAIGDPGIEEFQPDLVIGLFALDERHANDWLVGSAPRSAGLQNVDVALRLGRLIAQGIPTLLIVPPNGTIPHRLGPLLIAQCSIDDDAALNSALAPFLFARNDSPEAVASEGALDTRSREQLMLDLHTVRMAPSTEMGALAEILLRDTLFSMDVRFAENPSRDEDGVDLALIPARGGFEPLFVSLKAGHLTEPLLAEAERRLQQAVIARGGGVGLLLYIDRNNGVFAQPASTPLVIRIEYGDFVRELSMKPLPRVVDEQVEAAIERL